VEENQQPTYLVLDDGMSFTELPIHPESIPIMNDGFLVGTGIIGKNGQLTIHLFGPQGRELERLYVLGKFDTFYFAPNLKESTDGPAEAGS
jgi:hypothetical protein